MEQVRKEKYFSLRTAKGCKHILTLLIVGILVCSFIAALISSDGGRIKIEEISVDVRGAALSGELYYPSGTTDQDKYPAVIAVPGAGVINYNMRSFAEDLARRGYVVFNINAYGSGKSENPVYNENDQGIDSYDIFATPMGTLDAINYLRTVEFVDSNNIGVVGHSQGSRRAGYAALMDSGYLSFNDVMFNALHDTFGLSFTKADLAKDADSFAVNMLNADQMKRYDALKKEYSKDYESMCRSICLVGSTAQYVNPTKTVTVAGIEVTRTCKVNMCIINGSYDFGYVTFNNGEATKKAWYIDKSKDIVEGAYYSLNDVAGTSKVVGTFRTDSVNSNPALKEAIKNRSLRIVMQTRETHPKNFLSPQTTAMTIDYFNQTLNHNADTVITSKGSIVFMWREMFNFIAMLLMLFMLYPIIKLMTMTEKYSGCALDAVTSVPQKNRKLSLIIIVAGTLVLNFLAIYLTNLNKCFINFKFSNFFPLMITCWSPYRLLVWLISAAIIIVLAYLLCTSGFKSFGEYMGRNFKMGFKNILKCLVIAVFFIFCAYMMLAIIEYFFLQDFRLWLVSFSVMKADHWFIALRYALLALPFFFISSSVMNYLSDVTMSGMSETKDLLLTVFMNTISIWICCAITIIMAYGGLKTDGLFSSFMTTYSVVIFVPVTVFVARKTYQMTKSVWTGVFANSLLMAWTLVCISGTNASYVAQNWLSNFLGL